MSSNLILMVLAALWMGSLSPVRETASPTPREVVEATEVSPEESAPEVEDLGAMVQEEYKNLSRPSEAGPRERAATSTQRIFDKVWGRVQNGIAAIFRSAPDVE